MIYKILTGLLNWINMPSLDEQIKSSFTEYVDMIYSSGYAIFKFFIPDVLINVGLPIVLVIFTFKYGYYFVMWIIKKIPMAGIS